MQFGLQRKETANEEQTEFSSPATAILFHPPLELQRYSVCINAVRVNFTMVTWSPAVCQCVYAVTDSFGWSQIVTSVAALRTVHTGVTTS